MFFRTAIAVAVTAASAAVAQTITFNEFSVAQCATSTVTFNAAAGSYYVAIVPANDACTSAPFADFHDISSGSVDVLVKIASGTQIQAYVADDNGNEFWSGVLTVGDGDAACLTATAESTTETSTTASSSPSAYVVPANNVANTVNRASSTGTAASANDDLYDTPANAATNGASTATASLTLIGGAIFAAAALL